MTRQFLIDEIQKKQTYLCIGLDTDIHKLPSHLLPGKDAMFAFNKEIIDATKDLCVAYKINTAFYEALGAAGWEIMARTVDYIPAGHFKIADAKRGDIGNTSSQYARAFFEAMNFDAVTVAPYMGEDSVRPFLAYTGKWTILLGLTSNKGSEDFQQQKINNEYLYELVLRKAASWGSSENLMFVIGATKAKDIMDIRKIIPENFFLVPGIGAQGGSLADVSRAGLTKDAGLLVNASRSIIYAGHGKDFAEAARAASMQYCREMKDLLH